MSSCTPIATATVIQTNVVTAKQTRTVTAVQTIAARRARFVLKRQESDTASQGASESATGTTIPTTSPTSEPTTIATTPNSSPDFTPTPTPTTEQSEPSPSNNEPTPPPNTTPDSPPTPSDTPPSDPPPVSTSTPVSPPQDSNPPPEQATTTPPPPPPETTTNSPPPPPDSTTAPPPPTTTTAPPPPTTTTPPPPTTTDPPPPTTTDPPPPTTPTTTLPPPTTTGGQSGVVTTIIREEVDDVVMTTVVAQTLYGSCDGGGTVSPTDTSATGTITLSPITLAPELPTTTDTSNGYLTTMPDGQTLSISGGITIVVSQIVTNSNGHLTTVIVPIATLSPDTPRLTPSQRDGIIAGSLLGAFTLVLSVIAIIFFARRRQVRRQEEEAAQIPQPRRLLETEDQFDLAAPINPNSGVGWQSGAPMSQYDDPFASHVSLGMSSAVAGMDLDGPPRLLRPRTSVSGSIFHEGVWPPPGAGHVPVDPIVSASNIDLHESITDVMGAAPAAAIGIARGSIDSEAGDEFGIPSIRPSSIHSRGADSTRPLLGRDANSPLYGAMTQRSTSPASSLPPPGILRPSSPTSILSSPISFSSRPGMVPSPAAIAKAQEARASTSSGGRFGRSRLGLVSNVPRSTESSSVGHGSSSDHHYHSQRDSITAPLIDLRAASPDAGSGEGPDDEHRGFREAMGARLGVLGLGGGPSPGTTPLENEIPPLYSMIRRDTDISIERAQQRAREEAEQRDRGQDGGGPSHS